MLEPLFPDSFSQRDVPPSIVKTKGAETQSFSIYQRLKNFNKYFSKLFTSDISNKKTHSIQLYQQEKNLENTGLDIDHVQEASKRIEENLTESESLNTVTTIIQDWVVDFTLKDGAFSFHHGLPFMLEKMNVISSPSNLSNLNPAFRWMRAITDVIDLGTGLVGIFHKKKILNAMQKTIAELKSKSALLQPEQLKRLEYLIKLINYEEDQLSTKIKEQTGRGVRSYLSITSFSLSWLTQSSLVVNIVNVLGHISSGIGAIFSGVHFYKSSKNLKTHRQWSKDFIGWVKSKTLSISREKMLETTQQNLVIQHLKTKRNQRNEAHLKILNETNSNEKMNLIHDKVYKIKCSGLQNFIEKLNGQEISVNELQERLQEKLGCTLDPLLIQTIRNAYVNYLTQIENTKDLPSKEKQELLIPAKKEIEKQIGNCVRAWMNAQSKETLISTYIDYQAVLDSTVKSSLVEMVKIKHGEAANILTVKRNIGGISFTIASAIFAAGLAFMIIALVANPIGAAALVMILLTAASITIGFALAGVGHYYAYREQPRLTSTILKGAYLRLYSYYIVATIHRIKEKIANYVQHDRQQKREQLAASSMGQLPLFSSSSSPSPNEALTHSTFRVNVEQDFQKIQLKSEYWKNKAIALEKEFEESAWKDFAEKSDLQVATQPNTFDTLEVLAEALSDCDLTLLDADTIEFLEKQLGINIHILQKEIEKDPQAIKKLLKEFFNTSAGGFVKFIQLKKEEI